MNLRNDGEYISVHYRYFWLSRYTYSTDRDLYKNFKSKIKRENYLIFLKELETVSKDFARIIKPKPDYFRTSSKGNNVGKVDLECFVNCLDILQNTLNIEQVQVLLITLIDRYNLGLLSFRNMKSIVKFLEEFHFIYNGIMTERTNTLVSKYGKADREIYNSKDQNQILLAFKKLKKEFISLLPEDNQKFISKFIQIKYSSKTKNMDKNQIRKNSITKYEIYKLEFNQMISECKNGRIENISLVLLKYIAEDGTSGIYDRYG